MTPACNTCPPLICDLPDDLDLGGGVFSLVGFTFIINCPPGFYCFVNEQSVHIPPKRIPPVVQPPPFGETITLRLQGCTSLITRVLPGNATQAQINAAIASMQAEWASQQALCDVIHPPPPPDEPPQPPVPPPRPVTVTIDICGNLPTACVGTAYSAQLRPCAVNPVGAFTWALISGSLPPGVTMFQIPNSRNLFFGGTPTTPGRYTFLLRMQDAFGHFAQRAFTIGVMGFTSGTPPDPVVGVAYTFTFTVTGGTAPYTFSVGSGSLPDGLTLSAGGMLSGTPTTAGQIANFTVCVTDSF